jgi:hypothetical protein
MRLLRYAVVIAATVLLSGCYETMHHLFSTDGDDRMPIELGNYDCVNAIGETVTTLHVTPRQTGDKYIYRTRIVHPVSKSDTPVDISFHKVSTTRYIAAIQFKLQEEPIGQGVGIVEVRGHAIVWMGNPTPRDKALKAEFGVGTNVPGSDLLSGSAEKQLAFLRKSALETDVETVLTCKPRE